MENKTVLEIVGLFLDSEDTRNNLELNYESGEGTYTITLIQDTFFPADIELAQKICKQYGLSFSITDDRLSFYEK